MTRYERINQLLELKRFQEVHDHAIESLAAFPQDAVMHWYSATALMRLGRLEESLSATQDAITLNPNYARCFEVRGIVLSRLGRHEESHASFERSLSLDPTDSYTKVGFIEALLGEPENSRPSGRNARLDHAAVLVASMLENLPNAAESHLMHAKLHRARGDHDQSLKAAQKALQINPNSAIGHQLVGLAQERTGNIRAAGDSYVSAGKLDPTSTHSRDLLGNIGKGIAPVGLGLFALSRVGRIGARSAEIAGVPIVIILVLVAIAVVVVVAMGKTDNRPAARDLSPEAQRIYEANKEFS